MLKAAICAIMGSLITSKAETRSYLDAIDPSTNVIASNGWHWSPGAGMLQHGEYLIDGDFLGN